MAAYDEVRTNYPVRQCTLGSMPISASKYFVVCPEGRPRIVPNVLIGL